MACSGIALAFLALRVEYLVLVILIPVMMLIINITESNLVSSKQPHIYKPHGVLVTVIKR